MNNTINWEERRWLTASLILSGMASNYHNGIYPSDSRAENAVYLADCLIKVLTDPTHISHCAELYQREQ